MTSRTTDGPAAVPLRELLRSIPTDARLIVEDGLSSTSHPVGRLAHTAAAEIDGFDVANYDLTERLRNAEWRLRQLGYERCSSIACNCKGYHFNGES